jgi:hypothetical protein
LKGSTRRGSGNVRRSFLHRRKQHKRNNSKDSREFTSFSEASLNSDSVPQLDGELIREFTSFSEASLNSDSVPQLDGELIREFTSFSEAFLNSDSVPQLDGECTSATRSFVKIKERF